MIAPKREVGRGFTPFVPQRQGCGEMIGGSDNFAAVQPAHIGDFHRGETIPPLGKLLKQSANRLRTRQLTGGGHLRHESRTNVKNGVEQFDQLLHACIANAVFAGRRKREQALEPQDIPGIEQRAAGDAALQEIDQAVKNLDGGRDIRRDRCANARCERGRAFRLTDAWTLRECRPPPTGLPRHSPSPHRTGRDGAAAIAQARCRAKNWLRCWRMPPNGWRVISASAQPVGLGAAHPLEQTGIILIAQAGDARHQRCQSNARIVGTRSRTADAGAHQDSAGQHSGGFKKGFRSICWYGVVDPIEQTIQRNLPHHVTPITPLSIDLVRIPFAENVIRAAVGGMAVIVRARIA